MSDKILNPGEQQPDLGVLAADTTLLDTLGRGEPAPAADPVAAMLAAWRADLGSDITDQTADLPAVDGGLASGGSVSAGRTPQVRDTDLTADLGGHDAPAATRRTRRAARWAASAAAAAVLAAGGLVVAAGHATPTSPLWPITRVAYPERADAAAAEHAIGQAREAATQGRYDDARRLLDRAEELTARVREPIRLRQLRAELQSVRAMLPAAAPAMPVTPAPSTLSTPTPTGKPAPTPTAPPAAPPTTRAATTSGGRPPAVPPTPILPSVGAPPLPGPTPTGSLLPSLPLPGVTGLIRSTPRIQ
jgi:hypothetical protein